MGLQVVIKIVAPPHKIEAPDASNKNLTKSIHKYIIQARPVLLKAAKTTCFTGVGLH